MGRGKGRKDGPAGYSVDQDQANPAAPTATGKTSNWGHSDARRPSSLLIKVRSHGRPCCISDSNCGVMERQAPEGVRSIPWETIRLKSASATSWFRRRLRMRKTQNVSSTVSHRYVESDGGEALDPRRFITRKRH